MVYRLTLSPTTPISAVNGRAQPLGQPVRRTVISSSASPASLSLASMSASTSGETRSASVMACPHMGSAGHAIEYRNTGGSDPANLTPADFRVFSMPSRSWARMPVSNTFCCGVRWMAVTPFETTSRSAERSWRPSQS